MTTVFKESRQRKKDGAATLVERSRQQSSLPGWGALGGQGTLAGWLS